eukprot:m.95393 g.95393  ORF g.95393 m.95393 type:complete len:77 (+) comp12328_c0_seq1:6145-6375(+)
MPVFFTGRTRTATTTLAASAFPGMAMFPTGVPATTKREANDQRVLCFGSIGRGVVFFVVTHIMSTPVRCFDQLSLT